MALRDEIVKLGRAIQPPRTEVELADFERQHGITLPPGFRDVLLAADGGLGAVWKDTRASKLGTLSLASHAPDVLARMSRRSSLAAEKAIKQPRPEDRDGMLPLCHTTDGCTLLVLVNTTDPKLAGRVWLDDDGQFDPEEGGGLVPTRKTAAQLVSAWVAAKVVAAVPAGTSGPARETLAAIATDKKYLDLFRSGELTAARVLEMYARLSDAERDPLLLERAGAKLIATGDAALAAAGVELVEAALAAERADPTVEAIAALLADLDASRISAAASALEAAPRLVQSAWHGLVAAVDRLARARRVDDALALYSAHLRHARTAGIGKPSTGELVQPLVCALLAEGRADDAIPIASKHHAISPCVAALERCGRLRSAAALYISIGAANKDEWAATAGISLVPSLVRAKLHDEAREAATVFKKSNKFYTKHMAATPLEKGPSEAFDETALPVVPFPEPPAEARNADALDRLVFGYAYAHTWDGFVALAAKHPLSVAVRAQLRRWVESAKISPPAEVIAAIA